MLFRRKFAACLAGLAVVIWAAPAGAATLRFSGGANVPPTDLPSYLRHVYCERLPRGAAATDPGCRAVLNWMASNVGRNRAAWTPPPIIH